MSLENVLTDWHRRAQESQFSHYEAARYFNWLNNWLGIPALVLSTIVGTSIFASLSEQNVSTTLRVFLGYISLLAACLSALQTFLRFAERAKKH